MTPAQSSSSEQATRRSVLRIVVLTAGALACNLPAQVGIIATSLPDAPTSPPPQPSLLDATDTPLTSPIPETASAPTATSGVIPLFVVDSHEDIAWNWLEFGRDPRESAYTTRAMEAGGPIEASIGQRVTGLQHWLEGRIGVIFSSLFVMPQSRAYNITTRQVYSTSSEAHDRAMEQLQAYQSLDSSEAAVRVMRTRQDLDEVIASWAGASPTVGLLVAMEGADPIEYPAQVRDWYDQGVRAVGLAWASTRYAGGTAEPGPLTEDGRLLLAEMAPLNLIADMSHIAEEAFFQALDAFPGIVIATHSNPRRYLPTDRGLSDDMLRAIAGRDGVIGIVAYNRFLLPGWEVGDPRSEVPVATVAEVIDYVAQLIGSIENIGIGSDFDGGFGLEAIPYGMNTVADLLLIAEALSARGYTDAQIASVMNGNWLRVLRRALP